MSNPSLTAPHRLAGLPLRNRIIGASIYERRADEDGFVTDELAAFHERLARGGAGLVITGAAFIDPAGRNLRRMTSVHSDRYIDGLRMLTDRVHEAGGLIALQITHGGRQTSPRMLGTDECLAPSAIPCPVTGSRPRAMTDPEIWRVVDAFGDAAWRARAAGFDAVEIQAAHGELISSFLSGHTNKRDDYWGGDEERRFHMLEEVMRAVRRAVDSEFPVIVKMNATDRLAGGIGPDEAVGIAMRAAGEGADAIELSGGMLESRGGGFTPEGPGPYYLDIAIRVKAAVAAPLILTGGMRSPEVMESVLASGAADLIGVARALLADPDMPRKIGEGAEITRCDGCGECTRYSRRRVVECVKNNPEQTVSAAP